MDDPNVALLIDDLAELAKAWRLRGFVPSAMISAIVLAAVTVCQGAGLSQTEIFAVVSHHLGLLHNRSKVQA